MTRLFTILIAGASLALASCASTKKEECSSCDSKSAKSSCCEKETAAKKDACCDSTAKKK